MSEIRVGEEYAIHSHGKSGTPYRGRVLEARIESVAWGGWSHHKSGKFDACRVEVLDKKTGEPATVVTEWQEDDDGNDILIDGYRVPKETKPDVRQPRSLSFISTWAEYAEAQRKRREHEEAVAISRVQTDEKWQAAIARINAALGVELLTYTRSYLNGPTAHLTNNTLLGLRELADRLEGKP